MNVTIHGLAAFSYSWNKERDHQVSMIKAFKRAVMAISTGITINADDVRLMLQDYPTSIFARSVSKRPVLSNLLYTDDSAHHQQTALSTTRGGVLNPLGTNASELSCLTDISVGPTDISVVPTDISMEPMTSTSDKEEPRTDESDADLPDR